MRGVLGSSTRSRKLNHGPRFGAGDRSYIKDENKMNLIKFEQALSAIKNAAPVVSFTTHTRFFVNENNELECWTTKTRMHQSEKLLYKGTSQTDLYISILRYERAVANKCKCKNPIAFLDHGAYLECNKCHGLKDLK